MYLLCVLLFLHSGKLNFLNVFLQLFLKLISTDGVCVLSHFIVPTLYEPMDCKQPARFLCPWDFTGKNTGKWQSLSPVWLFVTPMDYKIHRILQTRILEWVAFPFSRGSSQLRDWTLDSCIAGRLFTSWATREDQEYWSG